jgi:hypothetical protein
MGALSLREALSLIEGRNSGAYCAECDASMRRNTGTSDVGGYAASFERCPFGPYPSYSRWSQWRPREGLRASVSAIERKGQRV